MQITAVTALYDLGRASHDGRGMNDYIAWLNKTLQVPLDFIIFLDPSFDTSQIQKKQNDRIVRVAFGDLLMSAHLPQVREIIARSKNINRRDLTFRLPEYSTLVMSKPEFMRRAAAITETEHLIWIDAGLSRFLPDLRGRTVVRGVETLLATNTLFSTSLYLAQRLRIGKLPHYNIGKCVAFINAGDFIVARSFAAELENRVRFMVESEWRPAGLWDNEQVAIGCLIFRDALPDMRILQTDAGALAPVTRWLFGEPFLAGNFNRSVVRRLIQDEIRLRLAPERSCYRLGDFPEDDFQNWSARQAA